MNTDTLKGDWKVMRGKVRERWGKLTNDDLDVINGKREQLAGLLQKHYGESKDAIERQIEEFERSQR